MARIVKTSAGIGRYRWEWNEFCYLVAVLKDVKDFKDILNVFIDLHTQKEIAEIIRRLLIASYLVEGKNYDEIGELTGAGRNTIAKINQKLLRQKSVLERHIKNTGSYRSFLKQRVDQRDALTRLIDNTIAKRDIFGLLTRRPKRYR